MAKFDTWGGSVGLVAISFARINLQHQSGLQTTTTTSASYTRKCAIRMSAKNAFIKLVNDKQILNKLFKVLSSEQGR